MARQSSSPSISPIDFEVAAIPPRTLDAIRINGIDRYGNPLSIRKEERAPLRCCLREATAGELIAAIAYCPFPWHGPFAEVGPVFIHAEACDGYVARASYPTAFRHRRQIFRAYGYDRAIARAEVVDGIDAEPAIAELLRRPEVDFVHSRNVAAGCFMFEIRRA
jgi:hypothetical protein